MAYYRFVATALLLRQCQRWHKMQSRQQQHSQPACPSSFLSTYREQAGQGCRWCRIELPMTLIGCLLAVAADSDGEGSAAASNETLATVFTQVCPYIVRLFDFLCSNHRISRGLLTRLHNSSSGGATWPHSWLQLTSPLRIPCTSTVPSIMQPPQPTWLLHVTLPSHGQPALPRPHAAPLQKALTRPACSTSPLAPHPHVAPAQKHCSRLQPSAHLPHVPPAPALDPQPQIWLAQTNIGLQLQRCLLNEKNLIQDEYGNCTDKTRNIFCKVVLNSAMPAADAKLRQKRCLQQLVSTCDVQLAINATNYALQRVLDTIVNYSALTTIACNDLNEPVYDTHGETYSQMTSSATRAGKARGYFGLWCIQKGTVD